LTFSFIFAGVDLPYHQLLRSQAMNERDLDRLLRQISQERGAPQERACAGTADFADAVLARLPGMRFVIPGSHPGTRILVLAGALGLLTSLGISLPRSKGMATNSEPPPLTLFQPEAVESWPTPPTP
jgi:hypothetical protein